MNEVRFLEEAAGDECKGVKLLHNAASDSTGKPMRLKYIEELDVSGVRQQRSSADRASCRSAHGSGAAPS